MLNVCKASSSRGKYGKRMVICIDSNVSFGMNKKAFGVEISPLPQSTERAIKQTTLLLLPNRRLAAQCRIS
jgi:hypothetical protein